MAQKFDIVIIGGGPGGYVCAIRAAQLGMKVAVVEKRKALGGTCLNVGCIPSKALLSASEKFEEAGHHFKEIGIKVGTPSLDLKTMMKFKSQVVEDNTKGIDFLFKKNKITRFEGLGSILDANTVEVKPSGKGKKEKITCDTIIIATGSEPTNLPGVEVDEKTIVTSTGALELSKTPDHMIVIGGGVIGLELGTVWRRLGAKVTVVEYLDHILPGMDQEVIKESTKILTKQGITFKLGSKVTGAKKTKGGVSLSVEPAQGGKTETIKGDVVLVAIGRKPYTDNLGLETVGVETDERGRIKTDEVFETSVEGIYAIGDVIAGPMLAHKAEEEGVVLAEMLAGQSGHIDYNLVPGVVYTEPEIASIGQTEEQLKKAGIAYNAGKFPFMANGRARSMNLTDGFVKILADKETDKILGCHIVGHEAGTLIHEIAAVMEFGGSAEDVARICHAHPTLSEVVKEAALAVDKRPLHI